MSKHPRNVSPKASTPVTRKPVKTDDLARYIVGALPPEFRADPDNLRPVLERLIRDNPEHFLRPINLHDAAVFLGTNVNSLRARIRRGTAPDGHKRLPGVGTCYPSLLYLMNYIAEANGQPVIEADESEVAA